MEGLYHQTNRLLQELTEEDLFKLDQAYSFEEFGKIEEQFKEKLNNIHSNCEQLDILVNKEPVHKRNTGKYKVNQLKYDLQHVVSSFKTVQQRRYSRLKEEKEREALLARKFTTNDNEETTIFMDHELRHHSKLQEANRNIDELLGAGGSILSNLREQGSILKGAQKKVLDLANTLGLSNTVLRLIERRAIQDKYILYGGMVVVLICLYFILKYL
ncbi:Golgi SNAP receptor complex member 2 [Armadillidium nasatum]|uniref:Golgi SNAP receptor complex member 2 n=1 Tax=Armadillidium nasatum TaxID=96803 RepID=A0A5N5SNL8_9CRUS|nr:Golgi SNAP receptor complex member 2 [Armadillidium nasatum]